jgi:IS605 OrfB family transposase
MVEREVVKALKLNLLPPSKNKERLLSELFSSVAACCNEILSIAKSKSPKNFAILHNTSYPIIRQKYSLHSQILIDCIHQVWENLKTCKKFNQVPIRFNIPRSGKFSKTKRGNPVVVFASFNGNGRIALPIKQDGAYNRFIEHINNGWKCTQFRLHKQNGHYVVIANLRKKFEVKQNYQAVVGVDVNSGSFALTALRADGKILKQLYLGRDIWHKQWKFMKRRSKLRSYADKGSKRARRALKRIKCDERNFVTTRIWQISHEIVEIAIRYDAVIAIEKLKNLRKRNGKGRKPKRANRKIHRIPFAKFRITIQSVAWQNGIDVVEVPAVRTSQKCPRCGYTSRKNWVFFDNKRKLFRCCRCGFECNPDRTASLNIATLALERGIGFSKAICTPAPVFQSWRGSQPPCPAR